MKKTFPYGESPPLTTALAVVCEVTAFVVAFAPAGSLAIPAAAVSPLRAAAALFALVGVTVLWRAFSPGARPGNLFARGDGPPLEKVLYAGLLAAVILTFYRVVLIVTLNFAGVGLNVTVEPPPRGVWPLRTITGVTRDLITVFLFYGFALVTAGTAFGPRAGLFLAATLAAGSAIWPVNAPANQISFYPPWTMFVVWRLPEALAVGWLTEKTRNVLAPLVTVIVISWLAALGEGIYALFGTWPFLFACAVITLVAAEVLIAERHRFGRAVAGFFGTVFGRDPRASFLDSVLITGATFALYKLAAAAAPFVNARYLALAPAVLLIASAGLYLLGKRRRARANAATETLTDDSR